MVANSDECTSLGSLEKCAAALTSSTVSCVNDAGEMSEAPPVSASLGVDGVEEEEES